MATIISVGDWLIILVVLVFLGLWIIEKSMGGRDE